MPGNSRQLPFTISIPDTSQPGQPMKCSFCHPPKASPKNSLVHLRSWLVCCFGCFGGVQVTFQLCLDHLAEKKEPHSQELLNAVRIMFPYSCAFCWSFLPFKAVFLSNAWDKSQFCGWNLRLGALYSSSVVQVQSIFLNLSDIFLTQSLHFLNASQPMNLCFVFQISIAFYSYIWIILSCYFFGYMSC